MLNWVKKSATDEQTYFSRLVPSRYLCVLGLGWGARGVSTSLVFQSFWLTRSSLNRPCILQFVTSSVLAIKDNINCHPTCARGRVLSNRTRMSMIQSRRWPKKAKNKQTNKQHLTLAENSSCMKILFLLPPILSSRSNPKILKRHFLPKRILVNALQK